MGAARFAVAALGSGIALAGIAWGSGFFRTIGWDFLTEQFLAFVLGLALALVFLTYPARRGAERSAPRWYDIVLAIVSVSATGYQTLYYPKIVNRFFDMPPDGLAVSWIVFLAVVEGLRRTAGWSLVIVVAVFFGYAMFGHHVEGGLQTRKVELNQMVLYLGVDTSGLFGIVLLVGVTVVIPFVFFGQLLSASGGAQVFNDISLALMGRFRGGSAKISVLASSLFGSINGIVVSNILSTGVITIPLLKKSGFAPEEAAAVEASSSNGGQLMPPVMGAVAFLMADFLQISYAEVAVAALVPSLLYYVSLFIQVDLIAAKRGISGVARSDLPRALNVLARGWLFLTPFAILIYALFWLHREPENAAMLACATVMLVGFVVGYADDRLGIGQIWNCVVQTGRSSADIIMIAAAAGFIMGILQITGLGFALTLFLVKVGAGNLLLLLVISAVLCIVLGMGMPTLGGVCSAGHPGCAEPCRGGHPETRGAYVHLLPRHDVFRNAAGRDCRVLRGQPRQGTADENRLGRNAVELDGLCRAIPVRVFSGASASGRFRARDHRLGGDGGDRRFVRLGRVHRPCDRETGPGQADCVSCRWSVVDVAGAKHGLVALGSCCRVRACPAHRAVTAFRPLAAGSVRPGGALNRSKFRKNSFVARLHLSPGSPDV